MITFLTGNQSLQELENRFEKQSKGLEHIELTYEKIYKYFPPYDEYFIGGTVETFNFYRLYIRLRKYLSNNIDEFETRIKDKVIRNVENIILSFSEDLKELNIKSIKEEIKNKELLIFGVGLYSEEKIKIRGMFWIQEIKDKLYNIKNDFFNLVIEGDVYPNGQYKIGEIKLISFNDSVFPLF